MKQVIWTVPIYEEYIRLTYLSTFQKAVMDFHVKEHMTDYQIAMELNSSESVVQSTIGECKIMYDMVQPYSEILPKRKKTKKEKLKENQANED